MHVTIKNKGGFFDASTIHLQDGTPLTEVSRVKILIESGIPNEAEVTFLLPIVDIDAEVTVKEEHLKELAEAHGFDLVKKK